MKYNWKNPQPEVYYFYQEDTGLIVGQVHNITHTKIWVAKITITPANEQYLGQYITPEFAKIAVEDYWFMQGRTLLDYGNV